MSRTPPCIADGQEKKCCFNKNKAATVRQQTVQHNSAQQKVV